MTAMTRRITWCKNCLNMSTRPRIGFDERGWCNACQWMEAKKTLNWKAREQELELLLEKHRGREGFFDCITAVSGGKDGSYVSYMLKHKHNMNPLTVTVRPALELDLGSQNLKNFIDSGYNHIHITPEQNAMRALNKYGFIEKGFPYFGWLISVMSAVIRTALNFNISLLFYGEDGEIEYGGSTESKNVAAYNIEYIKRVYLEQGYDKVFQKVLQEENLDEIDLYFFRFPSDEEVKKKNLTIAHWSYFENWDPYRNYLVAKEHCGLQENDDTNAGTFTNFSQNDQAFYALHTYMMYLKFGFGRATQDAGIEIRRGAMSREQALNLVRLYDNQYPEQFIQLYLDYFRMSMDEFNDVLDRYANKDLFQKKNGRWEPVFIPGADFQCG